MIICYETESRKKASWLEKLKISDSEFARLIEAGAIVPAPNGDLVARLVGCFISSNQYCVFLPKYSIGDDTAVHRFQAVANSLRRYWEDQPLQRAVTPDTIQELRLQSKAPQREYELYASLHRRFIMEGLYTCQVHFDKHDSHEKVHWPKTIASKTPIHTNGSCLYASPISVAIQEQANIVTRLHGSVLVHLNDKYRTPTEQSIRNAIADKIEIIPIGDVLANRQVMARHVRTELSRTFYSDDIQLLNGILSFLEEDAPLRGASLLKVFGTNRFHAIWENACSYVLQNQNEQLKDKLSQPQWSFYSPPFASALTLAGGKQRPDLLAEKKDKTLILDAKYYYPLPESLCGWGDLVKQLFYVASFSKEGKSIINGLLFPDPRTTTVDCIGHVSMLTSNDTPDPAFEKIYVFTLNPDMVIRAYSHGKVLTDLADQILILAERQQSTISTA